jgi:uncharacterized protein YdgA (DUF945 family)
MKKSTVIGIVVALALLAYPVTAWWTGKQVETRLAEQYKMLEEMPFVKVVKRDFQGGFASSQETVTFELFGDTFRSLAKAQKEALASNPDTAHDPAAAELMKPAQITVRTNIKHGPFAGGGLVAAVADSELVFDDKMKAELAKVFGDKKPLAVHTVFNFGGGGSSSVTSPAFATTVPAEGGASNRVSWEGIKLDVDFASGMKSFTLRGAAPKLEVHDSKGVHMVMSGLQLEGKQQRIFDDEPLLYSGAQNFKIAQINFSAPAAADNADAAGDKSVLVKNVTYDISTPVNGEFIDIAAKMGAASVLVDKHDYGPVHYDLSFKRLHARTTAKLYRAMMKMYSDPAAMARNSDPGKTLALLAEPAMELLKHNPEFAIDRISFKSPQGEALVSAHVRLKDAKPEDLSNPLMMIAKLEAGADLALPEALLAEAGAAKAQSEEEKQVQRQMFAAQIEAFAGQGYVTRAGGLLKSKIEFKNGQLTVNGKPFDPRAMGGGGAGMPMGEAAPGDEPGIGGDLRERDAQQRQ